MLKSDELTVEEKKTEETKTKEQTKPLDHLENSVEENLGDSEETTQTSQQDSQDQTKEVHAQKEQDFSFCELLGKTEEGLKREFYIYQIGKLMEKIGLSVLEGLEDKKQLERALLDARRYGIKEVMLTPFFLAQVRLIKKEQGLKPFFCNVVTDYPLGQDGIKSGSESVKETSKKGADRVSVTFPFSAVQFSMLGEQKRKILRSIKGAKKPLGVLINGKISCEDLAKTLKSLENLKIERLYLVCDARLDLQKIEVLQKYKTGRKICLIKDELKEKDLSYLTSGKVDMLFSASANAFGERLYTKFTF